MDAISEDKDVVKLTISRSDAEWLVGFLSAPGLHTETEDEEMRRAFFHAINTAIHP